MKEIYREKLLAGNNWIDSTEKYGLVLTDDLDVNGKYFPAKNGNYFPAVSGK